MNMSPNPPLRGRIITLALALAIATLGAEYVIDAPATPQTTTSQGGATADATSPGDPASSPAESRKNDPAPASTLPAPSGTTWRGFEASQPATRTVAAYAFSEMEVYESPDAPEAMLTLPSTTILGTATVVGVVEQRDDGWLQVVLPMRPNGSTGWVRAEDVGLFVTPGRIVVDLGNRELVYYEDGVEMLRTAVGIGSAHNPTPVGQFYVTDNVAISAPNSPWGPFALGLSARSDVITEFNGGDGIIGIHGTNNPASIGDAISLGCIRLPNEMITTLHDLAQIGTPVEIRA